MVWNIRNGMMDGGWLVQEKCERGYLFEFFRERM